jgi:hypothetical protein
MTSSRRVIKSGKTRAERSRNKMTRSCASRRRMMPSSTRSSRAVGGRDR